MKETALGRPRLEPRRRAAWNKARLFGAPFAVFGGRNARMSGFTLIELMVVLVLIAIGSAVASLALRDPSSTRLDQEAARLAALLESARAEARASGLAVTWVPTAQQEGAAGFQFIGLPSTNELSTQWLGEGVTAEVVGARAATLGPEPLIGAQRIVLHLDDKRLTLATDGLGPFVVVDDTDPNAATNAGAAPS